MRLDRKTYPEIVRIHGAFVERALLGQASRTELRHLRRTRAALDIFHTAEQDGYYICTHVGGEHFWAQAYVARWLKTATVKEARACLRLARKVLPVSHFDTMAVFEATRGLRNQATQAVLGWAL